MNGDFRNRLWLPFPNLRPVLVVVGAALKAKQRWVFLSAIPLIVGSTATFLSPTAPGPTPVLKIFVWRGYADDTVIAPFEHDHHCYVEVQEMKTSDELFHELQKGAVYDVVSASSDIVDDIGNAGLSSQLDRQTLALISLLKDPRSETNKVTKRDRVPFMWGPNLLIYDPSFFDKHPPNSWSVLWNSQLIGKVAVWDDLSTLYMAAEMAKVPIYKLDDSSLERVERQQLRPLMLNGTHLWSDASELTTLFRSGQVVAALGWPLTVRELQKLDIPVAATLPEEGTTGWVDYLMVPANSRNRKLALEFVQYLTRTTVQEKVAAITQYNPTNREAAAELTRRHSIVDAYPPDRIAFWESLGSKRQKYSESWERSKSGGIANYHASNYSAPQ